jgi:hypothetical protein
MSSIEERLLRDIAEVTGGIDMTDSDLRDARESLDERIDNRRQRDRRRTLAIAAAAATVVVGLGAWQALRGGDASPTPAPPGPEPSELSPADQAFLTGVGPTADLLEGVWRLDNPGNSRMLFFFGADGVFRYDDTGNLTADPLVDGTYEVEGETITVQVDGGSAECAGRAFTLRANVTADGPLHVLPVGLEAGDCARPARAQWVVERLLPWPAGSDLKAPPGNSWDPPTGTGDLARTWFDPGGGYLVEIRDDGTYAVLAGAGTVTDTGNWLAPDSASRLTLMSSGETGECALGDLLVLGNLRARDLGTLVLQGDLERNDCDLPFSGRGWFRMNG